MWLDFSTEGFTPFLAFERETSHDGERDDAATISAVRIFAILRTKLETFHTNC